MHKARRRKLYDAQEVSRELLRLRDVRNVGVSCGDAAPGPSRLGRTLPPSYREFLLVTDGWTHAGSFVWQLRGTGEAGQAPLRYGVPEFDAAVRAVDWSAADAWPRLKEALALWRPLTDDHVAPVSLLADPRIAPLITPERGREILTACRGTGR
ncbi:SMI1/KNR4 family protein [Nonomuraea sp. ATR24]|uniref:SMI1/KNR4 family protein n=1 Tax=Nonomuraea sp. ATR24 TaxID=1676744 RepID=UPI0035BEF68A